MTKLTRRDMLTTLGVAATAAAASTATAASLGSKSAGARTKRLDLDTPEGNLDGFLKVRSDISGQGSVIWAAGMVWSHVAGRKARPLMRTQGLNLTRCVKDATGYIFLQRESVYFCDLETGEPLKTWFNPFIEREVEVFHFQNESVSSHYDLNGAKGPFHMPYVENSGDVSFHQDLFYSAPSPLNVEEYPAYAASNTYEGAGLYNWHAKRADIDNPNLSSVPAVISHTGVRQWVPWMEMGAWEGGLVLPSRGKKLVGGVADLPKPFLTWLEKNAPMYLTWPPLEQKNQVNTFYDEFRKHIEAKRAGRAGSKN